MNNRERRIRERYQQRQRERSLEAVGDGATDNAEVIQLDTPITWHGAISFEAAEVALSSWYEVTCPDGPGLRQWLRVKDDWTDLDAFVQKCRKYGFPETHPYGKLKEACPIVMKFDKYSL